jgi:hypothetical protein
MLHRPSRLNTATLLIPNLISRSALRRGSPVVFLVLALISFMLPPTAGAVDPPPDGGYPGQITAEGHDALFSLDVTRGATQHSQWFCCALEQHDRFIQHHIGRQRRRKPHTGSNNIDLGNRGVAGEVNTIRIGTNGTHTSTFMAGIRGVTVASGLGGGCRFHGSGRHGYLLGAFQRRHQANG